MFYFRTILKFFRRKNSVKNLLKEKKAKSLKFVSFRRLCHRYPLSNNCVTHRKCNIINRVRNMFRSNKKKSPRTTKTIVDVPQQLVHFESLSQNACMTRRSTLLMFVGSKSKKSVSFSQPVWKIFASTLEPQTTDLKKKKTYEFHCRQLDVEEFLWIKYRPEINLSHYSRTITAKPSEAPTHTLVLDLDETLIHSDVVKMKNYDFKFRMDNNEVWLFFHCFFQSTHKTPD